MATLTDLQSERIAFHLDFVRAEYLLALDRKVAINSISNSQKLGLVGQDLADLAPLNTYFFEGVPLCSVTSILGRVEKAYSLLSPDTIEDSLYVSQAGSVTLRGNELKNRENLYIKMVEYLAQNLGSKENYDRVGW